MKRPRRNHAAPFKAKVALAGLKGDRTLAERAQQYDVHLPIPSDEPQPDPTRSRRIPLSAASPQCEAPRGREVANRPRHLVRAERLRVQAYAVAWAI